ncbi:ROK family protein [Bacillus salipaludis]|uniref:ROK family protein n=1 Tax=Bacillus salipaludis TaxID=2547811 RepID=A0ABW8RBY0_9BACI
MINNSQIVKKTNEELIRKILMQRETVTISYLSKKTGLSIATCNNILNEFLQRKEILEFSLSNSTGGRKARQFKLNVNYKLVAGIAVKIEGGARSINLVVADWKGQHIYTDNYEFNRIDYKTIEDVIRKLLSRFQGIKALGIGIPGVANNGVIVISDVEELINEPIKEKLESSFPLKVNVENEMHYTLYGLYQSKNYVVPKTEAMVIFGKDNPPGARFIVNGNILTGSTNFAGELSYIPFYNNRNEQLQRLFNPGTVNEVVSKMIISIISMINPTTVSLTGGLIENVDVKEMYQKCAEVIPEVHMPEIYIIKDPQKYYNAGLITITLDTLKYGIQLVER